MRRLLNDKPKYTKTASSMLFVHGLNGHRVKTWRSPNSDVSWPKLLLPTEIPSARVLSFGYDARVSDWRGMVSKNRIGNHSMNMLSSLANYREKDNTVGALILNFIPKTKTHQNDRPVIFICHSMGGLVCQDVRYRRCSDTAA